MGRRLRTLLEEVADRFPGLDDPAEAIDSGEALVGGIPVRNPASLVRPGSSVALRSSQPLRGARKLEAALDRFGVPAGGRVALDLGAAAGGFTSVLLARGASRVYSVDAGHGQLLGSLRQDPRVVNLESTNLSELDRAKVPEGIELVTMDLSNLAVARAVPQVEGSLLAARTDLVALVKPMFELGLSRLPTSEGQLEEAVERAASGTAAAGWRVVDRMRSPVLGARGAVEFFVHARRG
ncbi:MAG: TlyA family rRNA (cytidine-2'-O)-methyltransferase [Candidatus Nephthysia bennettiae]|uniref:TlyA family rRNA (Cytidine-2'-O)-methyltransferase n=1 Tax=Candidatus Nephthysia bennettiae TaxID=3127016 RepID=A0A934K5Q5_9BACT|nr:TlyA family rRNA (cytidine-2'-O)-methyltransferase [Candidatus Dormibacteraeota bacterium]MBJ7613310.1 TlyA family rRNA (cytidine-2'-O)-methyltransferase [Candidatus Dormibacteraeota bacterium]PZR96322.1 MAG: TlyA family rRNA (cytidine-2'-O)-methyltransferase [Candidatus Dormibacteraeota bacterium]